MGGLANQWGGFGFHPGAGKAGKKQEELGGSAHGVCPRGATWHLWSLIIQQPFVECCSVPGMVLDSRFWDMV